MNMSNFGTPRYCGHRKGSIWKEQLKIVGDYLDFTDDEVVTTIGIGMITNNIECAMDTAVRYTLVSKGEEVEMTAKEMVNEYTIIAYYIESGIIADAGGGRWVVDVNKQRLWENTKSSGWNYDNPHIRINHCAYHLLGEEDKCTAWGGTCYYHDGNHMRHQLKLLDDTRRELIKDADETLVIRAINKSLNRMMNSDKVVKTSEGRGRTFMWNSWGWLKDIRQQHLYSESKKRKVGDKVNGWVYSVVQKRNMYGVEIDNHGWLPVEQLKYYTVESNRGSWYNTKPLAFFLTAEERDEYMSKVRLFMDESLTSLQKTIRKWKGDTLTTPAMMPFGKRDITASVILSPETVVENLPDPIEFFKQYNYNHNRREEFSQYISKMNDLDVVSHSVENIEVEA